MASANTRRARRNGFESASAEIVARELADQFGKLLGTYVDPSTFTFNAARGYWAHNHQDVQRIAGHFEAGGRNYSIGSWDNTLSALAKSGCHFIDTRGDRLADNDFLIEKGRKQVERDDSDEWYSLAQLEEILHREGIAKAEDK